MYKQFWIHKLSGFPHAKTEQPLLMNYQCFLPKVCTTVNYWGGAGKPPAHLPAQRGHPLPWLPAGDRQRQDSASWLPPPQEAPLGRGQMGMKSCAWSPLARSTTLLVSAFLFPLPETAERGSGGHFRRRLPEWRGHQGGRVVPTEPRRREERSPRSARMFIYLCKKVLLGHGGEPGRRGFSRGLGARRVGSAEASGSWGDSRDSRWLRLCWRWWCGRGVGLWAEWCPDLPCQLLRGLRSEPGASLVLRCRLCSCQSSASLSPASLLMMPSQHTFEDVLL